MLSNSNDVVSVQKKELLLSDLARYMTLVYFWMILGLVVTTGIAYHVWQTPTIEMAIVGSKFTLYSLLFLQILMIVIFKKSYKSAGFWLTLLMYLTFSALTGLTLSVIFLVYKVKSIVAILAATSFSFLGLATFGYVTHKDLKPLGTFCLAGLCGLIGFYLFTFILEIFFHITMSEMGDTLVSIFGVLIFSGLIAFDVQRIKNSFTVQASFAESINGALSLYLDFLNLFLKLLQLFGKKR